MPKHYKEMMDEIINKMDEDAPANAVAHGGVDMAPNAGKKKKKEVPPELMKVIMKKMSGKIKEDNDNNNVVFKLIFCSIWLALFSSKGVKTATTALCNGPFIPPIIIMKKPGITYA